MLIRNSHLNRCPGFWGQILNCPKLSGIGVRMSSDFPRSRQYMDVLTKNKLEINITENGDAYENPNCRESKWNFKTGSHSGRSTRDQEKSGKNHGRLHAESTTFASTRRDEG
jgi:hypothetical protein